MNRIFTSTPWVKISNISALLSWISLRSTLGFGSAKMLTCLRQSDTGGNRHNGLQGTTLLQSQLFHCSMLRKAAEVSRKATDNCAEWTSHNPVTAGRMNRICFLSFGSIYSTESDIYVQVAQHIKIIMEIAAISNLQQTLGKPWNEYLKYL